MCVHARKFTHAVTVCVRMCICVCVDMCECASTCIQENEMKYFHY